MAETDVVRNVRIKGTSEGLDALAAKLKGVADAQDVVAKSSDAAGASTERLTNRQLSAKAAYDRVQRSLDDQFRAQEKIGRVERDLQRAYDQGLVTEQRRIQLLDQATRQYGSVSTATAAFQSQTMKAANQNDLFTRSAGLARHELINLGRQAQDVATMFAMGAQPMQVFTSQAAQIFDVFSSSQGTVGGFFKQLTGGLAQFAASRAGLATGAGAIGTGLIYSAVKYADGQRSVENALSGVGRASGVTLDGINRLAEAEAAAAKVSVSSAREIASAYASTGKVDPTRVSGLIGFTNQYAAQRGLGIDNASKELSAAFADPLKGMTQLQDRLGGLSSASKEWIESLAISGNRLGAQNALVQVFSQSVQGATERTGFWSQTMGNMGRFFGNVSDGVGKVIAGTKSFSDQLADLEQKRSLFASLPADALGAKNQIAQMDAQITRLKAIVQLEQQRQAIEGKTAAYNAGLDADDIVRGMDSRIDSLKRWQEQVSKLDTAISLNKGDAQIPAWTAAREAYANAIKRSSTEADYERKVGELNLRAINARTVAEREAIAVDRERLEISKGVVNVETERVRLMNRAAEVQAQANRDAKDALKASRDQLALAGLRPGQRFQVEQQQAYRDNVEKFGGSGSIDRDALIAAIERTESGGRNVRNYRYDATHTAQGYFQITNETWRDIAKSAGIDLAKYPNAMSAPYADQKRAASALIDQRGVQPWAPHNAGLRSWLASNGGDATAGEIQRNAYEGREKDLYQSVIGAGEDDLKRQTAALETQRAAFGKSTEEVARLNAQQDLFNKLIAAGGADLVGKFTPEIERLAAQTGELARQTEEYNRMADAMKNVRDVGADVFKGVIGDLRAGKSGAEIFANALNRVADRMLDVAANSLFGTGNSFGLIGKLIGLGGGVSGGVGGGAATIASGTGGLYADGGYTGAGGKYDTAGFVHRGEYVFSAAAVSKIGLGNLDRLHRGAAPGYADGGPVMPSSAYATPAPFIHQPAPASNGNQPQNVNFSIDVRGATGNQEVQGMVAAGVTQAIRAYDGHLDKAILEKMRNANKRYG